MVRTPLAKGVDEDLDDDDDDEDYELDDAHQQHQQDSVHPQQLQRQPVPSEQLPSVVATAVAQTQKFQRRRSSVVVVTRTDELSDSLSVMEAGDDKSLRPRFLKERSATHADLSMATTEPLTVPQSKAGAFLLSVMAKARGYNLYDMRRVPFDPHRITTTNNLNYTNRKKEQGVPLRMGSTSSRRLGVFTSGSLSRSLLGEQMDENKVEVETQEQQRSMAVLVQELAAQRQQILKQLDLLHEVLQRLTEVEHDRHAQLCKQLVDANCIREVVSSLREFRFHIGLQMCAISILSILAEQSSLYAYAMSENDVEIILQKAMAVHMAHERLVVMASTLLHAIAESKTAANARTYKDSKIEKVKQRKASFVEAVAAELAHKSRLYSVVSADHRLQQRHSASFSGKVKDPEHRGRDLLDPGAREDAEEDLCNLAERGRTPSRSASRLRCALTADVRPPVLSANYHLEFARKSLALETTTCIGSVPQQHHPLSVTKSNTTKKSAKCGLDPTPIAQLRPMSSPARSSISAFHLTSNSLAVAAYAGAPLFVEPSPLSKRMANRGISSAKGLRRRLSFKKRPPQRIPTPLMPVCSGDRGDDTADGVVEATTHNKSTFVDESTRKHDSDPESDADDSDGGRKSGSHAPPTTSRSSTSDAYDDETYEDDFADDSEPSKSRLVDVQRLESDAELIDLLHELPFQDTPSSEANSTSGNSICLDSQTQNAGLGNVDMNDTEREAAAAVCIQRHVRGHATRKAKARAKAKATRRAAEKHRENSKVRRTKSHCDTGAVKRTLESPSSSHRKIDRHDLPTGQQRIQDFVDHGAMSAKPRRLLAQLHLEAAARAGVVVKSPTAALQKLAPKRRGQVKKPSSAPSAMATSFAYASSSQAAADASRVFQPSHCAQHQQQDKTGTTDFLKRIQALYSQGLTHHKENQLELAIASYEAALQIPASGREFASLYINLGSALMTQLKFAEALASFEHAERIHPTNTKAAYNCALALMHLDRTAQAEERLRRVLVLDPSHAKALHALSQVEGKK